MKNKKIAGEWRYNIKMYTYNPKDLLKFTLKESNFYSGVSFWIGIKEKLNTSVTRFDKDGREIGLFLEVNIPRMKVESERSTWKDNRRTKYSPLEILRTFSYDTLLYPLPVYSTKLAHYVGHTNSRSCKFAEPN